MTASWKWSDAPPDFTLHHTRFPITLTRWSARAAYRLGEPCQQTPLTLRLGPPEGAERLLTLAGGRLSARFQIHTAHQVVWRGRLQNLGPSPLFLENLSLAFTICLEEPQARRLAFFKNGFQSWTETRAFTPTERQMRPLLPAMIVLQDNPRNLAGGRTGEFASDLFAVLAAPEPKTCLLLGQLPPFSYFLYLQANLPQRPSEPVAFKLVLDFGGKQLDAGASLDLDPFVLLAGNHPNRIQDEYFNRVRFSGPVRASSPIQPPEAAAVPLPTGWGSWYRYFTKVTQADLNENLAQYERQKAAGRAIDWRYFILDDGYQTAVGDWLTLNAKFPQGLQDFCERCEQAGLLPGIWAAPFVARRSSRLFHDHPDWFLRTSSNRPVSAGWNPNWGWEGAFYGLDLTHPAAQDYLRQVFHTFVHEWGFRYLKLDFLYGACLYGRAYDSSLSPAERLTLGYRLIRETVGPDVFLLGCGAPLGPSLGWVDAMRTGPDVAPYWFDRFRYHLTRDPHTLCVKFAIRSILNRCQMHRKLWINDPDCLLLRASNTRLTAGERRSLVNAVIITGGPTIFSDDLAQLPPETWDAMAQIQSLAGECDRGRTWALDYLEREIPELVYNSQGYFAIFNFGDRPAGKTLDLQRYLPELPLHDRQLQDLWTGDVFPLTHGVLNLGPLPPHASRLLKLLPQQVNPAATPPAAEPSPPTPAGPAY